MKARTLFFVILFPNIYKQRHFFTTYPVNNGFLPKTVKAIVKDCYGFIWIMAGTILFYTIKNKQKPTIITTDTETGIPVETILIKACFI